jgi:hypothetical protein
MEMDFTGIFWSNLDNSVNGLIVGNFIELRFMTANNAAWKNK